MDQQCSPGPYKCLKKEFSSYKKHFIRKTVNCPVFFIEKKFNRVKTLSSCLSWYVSISCYISLNMCIPNVTFHLICLLLVLHFTQYNSFSCYISLNMSIHHVTFYIIFIFLMLYFTQYVYSLWYFLHNVTIPYVSF